MLKTLLKLQTPTLGIVVAHVRLLWKDLKFWENSDDFRSVTYLYSKSRFKSIEKLNLHFFSNSVGLKASIDDSMTYDKSTFNLFIFLISLREKKLANFLQTENHFAILMKKALIIHKNCKHFKSINTNSSSMWILFCIRKIENSFFSKGFKYKSWIYLL